MFVDATHWPLVVIGPVRHVVEPDTPPGILTRLRGSERRAIAMVIPGAGRAATESFDRVLTWARQFETPLFGPLTTGLAWVAPDRALRATLNAALAGHDQRAFGSPSATFDALLPALLWLLDGITMTLDARQRSRRAREPHGRRAAGAVLRGDRCGADLLSVGLVVAQRRVRRASAADADGDGRTASLAGRVASLERPRHC